MYSPNPLDLELYQHDIRFGRIGKQGWMKVDDQRNMTGRSPGELTFLNTNSYLFVGGINADLVGEISSYARFTNGFEGRVLQNTYFGINNE